MRLQFKYLVLTAAFIFLTTSYAFAEEVNWNDYKSGSAISEKSKKKMYIYFYSEKCPWCVKMENDTFKNEEVAGYLNKNFVPVKINVYEDRNTTAMYGIGPIPANVFMESDIKTGIYKRPGYIPPETFMGILETIHLEKY
ncbi:MAG: thioredoxin fold domain-containing protein [Desulfobacteraceae bacterium]|nr:thioredoxin fold domain-containing protein [Desulfobacteraceae bacterium]MCB9495232.1 thioredoxin fold domain-containing protein [Desulfobacteraceae bacterium]